MPDVNMVLNLLMFASLVVFGPKAMRAAQWKAQLAAKDAIIRTNEQTIASFTERITALEAAQEELRERADFDREKIAGLERDVAAWRSRAEEAARYSAPEALAAVSVQLGSIEELLREVHDRVG